VHCFQGECGVGAGRRSRENGADLEQADALLERARLYSAIAASESRTLLRRNGSSSARGVGDANRGAFPFGDEGHRARLEQPQSDEQLANLLFKR
jgi:hypothetical protein